MSYKKGIDKKQGTLLPICLDDYVPEDHICRVISAFIGQLDMSALGYKYAKCKSTGCRPYDPRMLLNLYVYGYLHRIRSSRRLRDEAIRNVEVMWLLDGLRPDDKTICNFRKDNAAALKKVFREFSVWCNLQGLYGKELVAVDGSKVRANSSRKNIHTQTLTAKELASVEKKISEYMHALEEKDAAKEEAKPSPEAIRKILERLNRKKVVLQEWQEQIEANGGEEISTVDPDARIMKQGGDGRRLDACYNVQTVVDDKNKLIVDFDVSTNPNENGTLPKITESAKEIMEVDEISIVGDRGYYNGVDIEECEQNGTKCYIPAKGEHRHAPDARYSRKHFRYNAEKDCYVCPEGHELSYKAEYSHRGHAYRRYSNTKACQVCPHKKQCTEDKKQGRAILRTQYQNTLDIVDCRMASEAGREKFRERKSIVEHPFGTTKQIWGYKQYLCRGLEKVTAEQSLTFLAYNFRRICKIFEGNIKDLMCALR